MLTKKFEEMVLSPLLSCCKWFGLRTARWQKFEEFDCWLNDINDLEPWRIIEVDLFEMRAKAKTWVDFQTIDLVEKSINEFWEIYEDRWMANIFIALEEMENKGAKTIDHYREIISTLDHAILFEEEDFLTAVERHLVKREAGEHCDCVEVRLGENDCC